MSEERMLQDILDTINTFATHVDTKFAKLDTDIGGIKTEIGGMKADIADMKSHMATKEDLEKLVTKEYFDKRFTEIHEETLLVDRKANTKLTVLIDELVTQKSIDSKVATRILALEPFPQH